MKNILDYMKSFIPESLKKLVFLVKVPEQRWKALSNFIIDPASFDNQYEQEKNFQNNLAAGWKNWRKN